jgi:hypothetical protein
MTVRKTLQAVGGDLDDGEGMLTFVQIIDNFPKKLKASPAMIALMEDQVSISPPSSLIVV